MSRGRRLVFHSHGTRWHSCETRTTRARTSSFASCGARDGTTSAANPANAATSVQIDATVGSGSTITIVPLLTTRERQGNIGTYQGESVAPGIHSVFHTETVPITTACVSGRGRFGTVSNAAILVHCAIRRGDRADSRTSATRADEDPVASATRAPGRSRRPARPARRVCGGTMRRRAAGCRRGHCP